MGRAVFCMIFDGEFDFTNDIAWVAPGMLSIRDIWAIIFVFSDFSIFRFLEVWYPRMLDGAQIRCFRGP